MGFSFSKSKYVATCTYCHKYAWLDKYKHDQMAPVDEITQSLFDNGHRVGELAQQYFHADVDVSAVKDNGKMDLDTMIRETEKHLALGTETIAEASFSYKGFFCSVDILRRNPDGSYTMYEVKSSQQDEPPKTARSKKHPQGIPNKYIIDAAYQQYVLTQYGLNLKQVCVVVLRRGYVRGKDLDLDQYFFPCDVTAYTTALQDEVRNNLAALEVMLKDENEPPFVLSSRCNKCPFWGYCGRHISHPSPFDVYNIDFDLACQLYEEGVSFQDTPREMDCRRKKKDKPLLPAVYLQVEYYDRPGDVHIDRTKIREFFDSLTFPIYALDFETYQASIPEYEGIATGASVPFQYSLHVMRKPDADLSAGSPDITEYAFLDEEGADARRAIAESLVANIPYGACVVAFHSSTEKSIVKGLAKTYADLADHLNSFVYRDPLPWFREGCYYTSAMGRKFSLKSVAPAMYPDDPEMNYFNLEGDVHNGTQAMAARGKLKELPDEERQALVRDLKKYCALDTWALVKVIRKLYDML